MFGVRGERRGLEERRGVGAKGLGLTFGWKEGERGEREAMRAAARIAKGSSRGTWDGKWRFVLTG